jgi:hypothetical protein
VEHARLVCFCRYPRLVVERSLVGEVENLVQVMLTL